MYYYCTTNVLMDGVKNENKNKTKHSNHLRSHSKAVMVLDHSGLYLENKFLENKSGRIFCFRQFFAFDCSATKLVTKLKVHVRCVECNLLDYLDAMCWLTN